MVTTREVDEGLAVKGPGEKGVSLKKLFSTNKIFAFDAPTVTVSHDMPQRADEY